MSLAFDRSRARGQGRDLPDGWVGGLLGVSPFGPWLPLILFEIVFGLSTDYEVFLISRIHERWRQTGDPSQSIVDALDSSRGRDHDLHVPLVRVRVRARALRAQPRQRRVSRRVRHGQPAAGRRARAARAPRTAAAAMAEPTTADGPAPPTKRVYPRPRDQLMTDEPSMPVPGGSIPPA